MSTTAGNLGLEETRALEERYLMRTYKRGAVDFVRGEGALLWDADGNEYLDFLTGISVCSLGHCHPAVVAAVREQTERLMHVSNLFYTEPMARLAQRLSESSLGGRVFFANSGTEANECAIKIARKHARARGVTDPEILSFEGEFHGRSYGALSATPGLARNESFWPMLPGFRSVPSNDAEALRAAVNENTAAVLIEPIQGEAGVYPTSEEALLAARQACDEVGALLILDEIQTGVGRTGSLWAYQQSPVRPDVITSAKALGGGVPIGACVTAPVAADVLEPGDHGSTFAGGPVATAAALAVLDVVDDPALLRAVRERGTQLREGLEALEGVRETRGRGLMVGVGLAEGIDAAAVGADLLRRGLVVNVPAPDTLRLLPPLVVDPEQIERAVGLIGESL
ncbi:MAG: acetylornithine/N-succinyldiaminopimelate aminotransferase [Solirubrobacterales bacterium]|jgi:predicted acetylornithine/succinylornithine family transaminase|nr:acetylornithine/N-succinyldiaminopimelate aminotransferase [Solirubrobacterales bacterium]